MSSDFNKRLIGETAVAIAAFIAAMVSNPADAAQKTAMQCLWPGNPPAKQLVAEGDFGTMLLKKATIVSIKGRACAFEKVSSVVVAQQTPTAFEKAGQRYYLFSFLKAGEMTYIAADVRDIDFE